MELSFLQSNSEAMSLFIACKLNTWPINCYQVLFESCDVKQDLELVKINLVYCF